MNPLVTIITPTFNSAATLRDTLESVYRQDYPAIEHILVDGGSSDDTLALASAFDGPLRVISEPDQGLYDAMNKGLQLAKGDIVGVLNSDDFYCHGQVISRIVELMNLAGSAAAYGDLCYVAASDKSRIVR